MPGKLLVVDDIATNRIILKVLLTNACYQVIQADCGQAALHQARAERPNLILLDLMMHDMDGIEVCQTLKADPATADIPVIVVTAARDTEAKMQALQAGADEFLSKPLDELTLLARVRNLLRAHDTNRELSLRDSTRRALGGGDAASFPQPQSRIALVAPTQAEALRWKNSLHGHTRAQIDLLTRAEVLRPQNKVPDLYVVAADMGPAGSGLGLLSDLRARTPTRNSAVIIAAPEAARESAAMALDLGASDLVTLPFEPREMALRIETQLNRKHQADRLRDSVKDGLRLAMTDPLTGLFNRRYALPHLAQLLERAAQDGGACAAMMLDMDRFKTINDRHGHAAGDKVLQHVAKLLTENLRAVDLVARIGGEEFLIALPDADAQMAHCTAERLRRLIGDTPVLLPEAKGSLRVSASIGLALSQGRDDSTQTLLERADQALYRAKTDGRDRVMLAQVSAA